MCLLIGAGDADAAAMSEHHAQVVDLDTADTDT